MEKFPIIPVIGDGSYFLSPVSVNDVVQVMVEILKDDSIDCVVEVMGGVGLAKTVVLESLKNGKHVVTANKALIAENLEELHAVAKESGKSFAFVLL